MGLPTITPERVELDPGDEMILRFRSWQDYESLLARRLDLAGLRIRYSAETQEIRVMSPLPSHGKNADMLADLVKAMLRWQSKDWEAYTPITLKKLNEQGVEPDYCFYIQNRSAVLGKERIDLAIDPPPDLAIEVDFTSRTQPEDYQAIAIPEFWIYRQSALLIYLHDGSRYQETSLSAQFSEIDIKKLLPQYVDRSWQVGSSVALREFDEAIL